jgi:hypothetical protein
MKVLLEEAVKDGLEIPVELEDFAKKFLSLRPENVKSFVTGPDFPSFVSSLWKNPTIQSTLAKSTKLESGKLGL